MGYISEWHKAQDSLQEWIQQQLEKHKHMKPPKNRRAVVPRCCFTCKYFMHTDGTSYCKRPGDLHWDTCDMKYIFEVCDYWKCET